MLFKNLQSKWGVRFPKVELLLEQEEVTLGESCPGYLMIDGAATAFHFQKIIIDYQISLYLDEVEYTYTLDRTEFPSFSVQPATKQIFPFYTTPSTNTLLSSKGIVHYLVVHLTVEGQEDTSERVIIDPVPNKDVKRLFAVFHELGITENQQSRLFDGYLQEFRFDVAGFLQNEIAEVGLVISIEQEQMRLFIETALYDYLPEKEVKREVIIDKATLKNPLKLVSQVKTILQEMVQHPYAYSRDRYFYYQYHHPRLAQAKGTIGALLAGKSELQEWLRENRLKRKQAETEKEGECSQKKTKVDQEYQELFQDVFNDQFFYEDDE